LTGGEAVALDGLTRAAPEARRRWWWHGIAAAAVMAPSTAPEALVAVVARQGADALTGVRLAALSLDRLDAWTPLRRRAVAALTGG
jgi:hypothetical protein